MKRDRRPTRWTPWIVVAAAALATIDAVALTTATTSETTTTNHSTAFHAETDVAMTAMMSAMDVEPSGDVDLDFARMMIPHHQGAIDMAVAELRHGKDVRLRRLAQEIIVAQQQEIVVMRDAVAASSKADAGDRRLR